MIANLTTAEENRGGWTIVASTDGYTTASSWSLRSAYVYFPERSETERQRELRLLREKSQELAARKLRNRLANERRARMQREQLKAPPPAPPPKVRRCCSSTWGRAGARP